MDVLFDNVANRRYSRYDENLQLRFNLTFDEDGF